MIKTNRFVNQGCVLALFLSEGKAMEMFRKLREKPRGLALHLFYSLFA